jgi:Cdc6-like AAA superfamily ATPase
MGNPRTWFRRRRNSGSEQDPFADEVVLDLGRAAVMLHDEAPSVVPPPLPRTGQVGRLIRSDAFTVRPELARREPRSSVAAPSAPDASSRPVRINVPPRDAVPPRDRGDLPVLTALRRPDAEPPRAGHGDPLAPPEKPMSAASPEKPPAAPTPRLATPLAESAAFSLAAPGPTWLRGRAGGREVGRFNALLREAFTPTRPKRDAALFAGRFREMQRIIAAIEEERAHVVVYGERGSGKTSLSNILAGKATEAGYTVLQFACTSGVTFEEIFRSILRRIPASFLAEGLGGRARVENFEQLLPGRAVGVGEVAEAFGCIHERHVIIIIDEYDRVVSEEVKGRLAELIKIMSDASAPVTLLLIGVADDVRDLFGKHPSLQRTLVTVPMPLMTRRELETLIAAGEARAELTFTPAVRDAIVEFAQGLPYHAQLLCLFAARSALRRNAREIGAEDLRYAVERAADEAESRVKDAYALAVGTPAEPAFEDALFHAARAKSDEFGAFTAEDVAAAGGADSVSAVHETLRRLTELDRGAVLRRIDGARGVRYQFSSQMLRHYVLARQAPQRGLV